MKTNFNGALKQKNKIKNKELASQYCKINILKTITTPTRFLSLSLICTLQFLFVFSLSLTLSSMALFLWFHFVFFEVSPSFSTKNI